jgi:hypothetical protein
MVTVNVGEGDNRKVFKIHKKFAVYHSRVFKTAFDGNFAESETQSIDLDDVDTEVFGLFVQWLYTQDLRSVDKDYPMGDLLIKLWVLADRLIAPKCQNSTVCAIEARLRRDKFVRTDQVKYIYDNTIPGSPLRRLIVDQCSNLQHTSFVARRPVQDYPKEMLFDLVAVLLERRAGEVRPLVDMTRFYVVEPSNQSNPSNVNRATTSSNAARTSDQTSSGKVDGGGITSSV